VLGFAARGERIGTILIRAGLVAALLTAGGCASDAPAPVAALAASDFGVITFPSAGSLQWSAAGRRFTFGSSVSISGSLQFPQGDGPFPAVVLAHGCNGKRNLEPAWGRVLREWGYATFVVDSFRERGITEVCTNPRALVPLQRVPDAYGALRLLAAHPKIDPRRIALLGFSHGGALTMLAATMWAKDTYAPAGQPAFRAFFAFYPSCNADFPERKRVSAPVRIHIGEADDWTPAKPCAELAAALKASGQDVAITVYPGAHHAFDQAPPRDIFRPNVNNGSHCFPQSPSILGPISPAGVAGCVKKGATIGGNPVAADEARRNLRAQLAELLK
jgi:dienelactone hydrolase